MHIYYKGGKDNSIRLKEAIHTLKQENNEIAKLGKKDFATNTAYGDPIKFTKPSINQEFKQASSQIADSTQKPMMNDSGKQNTSKEYTTDRSYGDPLKSDVPPMNYTDKAANSIIAESTERASTKKANEKEDPTSFTAYGNPVGSSSESINENYKNASAIIAKSTEDTGHDGARIK